MESWKEIKNYEGIYQVSNAGFVRRILAKNGKKIERILKNKKKKSGYLFVCLSRNNEQKYFHIHRLVADAFLLNPQKKPCVNHKDMNKENNHVSNLEWVTIHENNIHARKNKTFKLPDNRGIKNCCSIQTAQILNNKIVYVWENSVFASRHYNISNSALNRAIRKNTKCIGFYWNAVSKDEYNSLLNNFTSIPDCTVNKRHRDTRMAQAKRIENINNITNDKLISIGKKCLSTHGRLIRKDYDIITKQMGGLTYIPTCRRFGSWQEFKKNVINQFL